MTAPGEKPREVVYVKVTRWPAYVAFWLFCAFVAWLIAGAPGT